MIKMLRKEIPLSIATPSYPLLDLDYIRGPQIGRGDYSYVYQCFNSTTGQVFALKIFRLGFDFKVDDANREIIIQHYLSAYPRCTPYILCYYDAKIWYYPEKQIFGAELATEYIPGVRIAEYHPANLKEVAQIYLQAWSGLRAIHQAGIVHRDIHGYNILITPGDHLRITYIDFGRACPYNPQVAEILRLTPCSDERYQDYQSLDRVCDILSPAQSPTEALVPIVNPLLTKIRELYQTQKNLDPVISFLTQISES